MKLKMAGIELRTLTLFSGRETQREAISKFLSCLQQGDGYIHPSVLSFFGVGGVGKTALRKKALADFKCRLQKDIYSITPPIIAEIDLDSDSVTPNLPVAQILGRVRTALNRQHIRTPSFDYLYLIWWGEENPDQSIHLREDGENERSDAGLLNVAELASSLASFLGTGLPGVAVVRDVRKLYLQFSVWFKHSRVRQRFDGIPEEWSQTERIERMPVMLANDLLDAIARQPQMAICLVIDGFERVQSKELYPDAQKALAALVSEVLRCSETIPLPDGKPLRGRIGFIIFGREKLRWAELYSGKHASTKWQQEIDHHPQLLGLNESDARRFLIELAAPYERSHGRATAADLIERHVAQILQAASEQWTHNLSFLPYYLELAVLLIRNNAENFEPEMIGSSSSELAIYFLRYLTGQHRAALQALALALKFDRKTLEFLIKKEEISGYSTTNFDWLVGDHWSFVTSVGDRSGFHSFHRHMQDSLVASLSMKEDRSRATRIIQYLLERYYALAKFDRPASFRTEQAIAYLDAMDLLRTHESSGLLATAAAVEWALKFDSSFDAAHVTDVRRPHLSWAVEISTRELGDKHPHTLASMNNLALTLQEQGELVAARTLQEKTLEIHLKVLGEEHPHTLTSMSNLALTLQAERDLKGARTLQEKTLEIHLKVLGEEHPHTLILMNNLAGTLQLQRNLTDARTLQEKVLEICRRILDEEHPYTLTSMSNLAGTLQLQGNLAGACALHEKGLEIRQRVLGKEHPDTLKSMNNLAGTLQAQGDLGPARDLHEKALEIRRRVLGDEHPSTLSSMSSLALTLQEQGELVSARTLQEKTLEIHLKVLGEEHPDTLALLNNLALTLQAQGDLAGARDLQENALEIQRRVLGEGHPHTLTLMNNLLLTLQAQGDLAAARALQENALKIQRRGAA
jgi:NTP pyrophosphatase (non-canonical NTP hydrolase)